MTMLCAFSHWSLPAHHSAASAGARPAGGFALARERLNSELGGQWRGRDRTLRLPVPIARIAEIALHAVQIGMDPGAILAALIHDDVVRLLPLVLARPPQRCQRRREAGGRLCLGEGTFELRQIHRETLGKQATTSARAKTAPPPARRRERARTASPRRTDGR